MNCLKIGITGGIGSGKSTVSQIYENQGYTLLKADDIAKQIMVEDKEIVEKIISAFGEESYTQNTLNTKYLANKVFKNPNETEKLNSIVHPPLVKKIKTEIEKFKEQKIVFVEAALIYEAKMENLFDYILLVTADEDTRIKRVIERNNESAHEIKSRMMHQLPEDQKRKRADFVIENNSSLDHLKEKALFFLNIFNTLPKSQ